MQNRGDTNGALNALNSGLKDDPDNIQILLKLGALYCQLNDFNKAVQPLYRANQLSPNSSEILMYYSKALAQTGRMDEALELAKQSLNLDPESFIAIENTSEIMFRANRPFGVVKCLELMHALRPKDKKVISDLSRFYQRTQQYEKAYVTYKKLWDDKVATVFDYASIGELAFLAQKTDEAIPYLKKALEMQPKNAHSLLYLGRCYEVQGDNEAAKKGFEKIY